MTGIFITKRNLHDCHIVITVEGLLFLLETTLNKLRSWEDILNRINVFPIPDNDTGTNLSLTFETMVRSLRLVVEAQCNSKPEMIRAILHSVLTSSNGSSGYIITQWLKAFLSHCFKMSRIDSKVPTISVDLPAFLEATEHAHARVVEAVALPQEGTVLTVMKKLASFNPITVTVISSSKSSDEEKAPLRTSLLHDNYCHDDVFLALMIFLYKNIVLTTRRMKQLTGTAVPDSGAIGFGLLMETVIELLTKRLNVAIISKFLNGYAIPIINAS